MFQKGFDKQINTRYKEKVMKQESQGPMLGKQRRPGTVDPKSYRKNKSRQGAIAPGEMGSYSPDYRPESFRKNLKTFIKKPITDSELKKV